METINVLDHGSVTLLNAAGPIRRPEAKYDADDTDFAISARMSYDAFDPDRERSQDLKLADYLIKNQHTTPLEMIDVWIDMKMPIFIARQFVRHRTVSINEVSARYVTLPEQWYIPSKDHVGTKHATNKQGRLITQYTDLDVKSQNAVDDFRRNLEVDCKSGYAKYTQAIADGIPNELARCHLHVNHYTHWLWKQDLHNLMHFLGLRIHSHAQHEARVYAQAIYDLLKEILPNSMELFDKYRRKPE